jgi:hypothetical protein
MPLFAPRISALRTGLGLGLVLCACLLAAPAAARADGEDPVVIERITNLNKKALDAYNNLDFEDARKLLKQALDMCSSSGLDRHPIKARTHVHMGVVLIAAKQQDLGVKQFRKAREIQPDIQVTKALANPEIIQAFEEAGAAGGADAGGDTGGGSQPPDEGGGGAEQPDISHLPVARGRKGRPVMIAVNVSPTLTGYAKIVLAYRPEGTDEFMARDMRRSGNRYTAEIPADATDGNVVQYYVEAEAEDESAVAASGSEEKPFVVSLSGKGGGGDGDDDVDEDSGEDKGKFFLSVLGGTGTGYVTGTGEVNADNKVDAGFAMSAAAHIVPEVGYFLSSGFRLSLQFRYQVVTGTTPLNLAAVQASRPGQTINQNMCGPDGLCSAATYAFAVIARATWIFGSDMIRPYFSFGVGGGQIRHVVTFTSLTNTNPNMKEGLCGTSGKLPCVDTVLSGPIFAGPGGGIIIDITPTFGVVAEIGTLLGFPKFTFHLDGNAGVAAKF